MHFESTLSYSAHGITTVGDISPREGIPKPEKRRLEAVSIPRDVA